MPDKKLTDSEIVKAKEISLKEQIEYYNERKKEVFDSYYRRNIEGSEDTLEICVLRESAVLISKLESIINRLQAENETLRDVVKQNHLIRNNGKSPLSLIKAEAYEEFIDKFLEKAISTRNYFEIKSLARTVLNELVGEDNGNAK